MLTPIFRCQNFFSKKGDDSGAEEQAQEIGTAWLRLWQARHFHQGCTGRSF